MKRHAWMAGVAAGLLVTTTMGAPASASPEPRRERHGYNSSRGSNTSHETNLMELEFSSTKSERLILLSIEDQLGASVLANVSQDVDGDGSPEWASEVCTETSTPLKIHGGGPIDVTIEGACAGGVPPTSGWVDMTFFVSRAQMRASVEPGPEVGGPRAQRTVVSTYHLSTTVGVGQMGVGAFHMPVDNDEALGGGLYQASDHERFLSVLVEDATGLPVGGFVTAAPPGEFPTDVVGSFCRRSEVPIEIPPGYAVRVAVATGACSDLTLSVPTTGTITVTFSNTAEGVTGPTEEGRG